jgi:hypothetical protein
MNEKISFVAPHARLFSVLTKYEIRSLDVKAMGVWYYVGVLVVAMNGCCLFTSLVPLDTSTSRLTTSKTT